MGYVKRGLTVALGLIGMSTAAMEPREVIEETHSYRVFANGDIERKADRYASATDAESSELAGGQPGIEQWRILGSRLDAESGPDSTGPSDLANAEAIRGGLQENAVPGLWKGFGGVPYGCNGRINAIEKGPDGKIYLGGDFSACNDVVANHIVAWDPATNRFEALGSPAGVNRPVLDLEFAPNGDLIVGGRFIFRAGGNVSVNGLARWDGTTWSSVSPDFISSWVAEIEIDPVSGNIFVGGFFSEIFLNGGGSLTVNRVAMWDGSQWNALGDGMDNSVEALKMVNGTLYAGGRFSQAGGQPADFIAAWDGAQWSPVGGGMDDDVEDLESDGMRVFAGGRFNTAGGVTTGRIAAWNGTTWSSIDGPTCCFGDMDYANGKLVVTGGFSSVNGVSTGRVAIWDGANWSATADDSSFSGFGWSVLGDANDIFIGGDFSVIGTFSPQDFPVQGTFANRIARFEGATQEWTALGNGEGNNLSGPINDMVEFRDELWVTGGFVAAGMLPTPSSLARWNGSEWLPVPGADVPCGIFSDLATGSGDSVFARTTCNFSFGTAWNNTARFDGIDWQPVGQGLADSIFDVNVDAGSGDAYYVGSFTATEGDSPITVNRIARWDGVDWTSVGVGTENGVSTSTSSFSSISSVAANNGSVMVEGSFDRAGTVEVDRLALWDGSAWGVPGDGLNDGDFSAFILALEGQGSSVFAAGSFNRSGTEALRNIAQWSGTSWLPLQGAAGEGVGFTPRALHATPDKLYVGGSFLEAGGRPANRIARWDGADWGSLGAGSENGLGRADGTFDPVSSMQSNADGIFVGGLFGGSNDVTSPNLIRFVPMENLNLDIEATVSDVQSGVVSYEVVITNNGEFALVDSVLEIDLSPLPASVAWTCQPVAPASRGCPAASGTGAVDLLLELPSGASAAFNLTVNAGSSDPFIDFEGTYRAAPVAGATGTLSDTARISTAVSSEGVFKDDFEG